MFAPMHNSRNIGSPAISTVLDWMVKMNVFRMQLIDSCLAPRAERILELGSPMNSTDNDSDRRSFPRIPKEVTIGVTKLEYPLPGGPGDKGTVRNIATHGICCKVPVSYETGTLLSLEIDLKGWQRHKRGVSSILNERATKEPLTAIGQVMWCSTLVDGAGFELGVRFTDIYEDDHAALMRYLEYVLERKR